MCELCSFFLSRVMGLMLNGYFLGCVEMGLSILGIRMGVLGPLSL